MFRIIEVDKGVKPQGNVKLYGKRAFKDYYMEALSDEELAKFDDNYAYDIRWHWQERLLEQGKKLKRKEDFKLAEGGLF